MQIRLLRTLFLIITAVAGTTSAEAGMIGAPKSLRSAIERIRLDEPTLAPMAYTQFCARYVDDCFPQNTDLDQSVVRLNRDALADLTEVNESVNATISPEKMDEGIGSEVWAVDPESGDCNDYAVTKRHQLISRGWPSDALLLAEVAIPGGEHHLVLVVRTTRGDMVLDNLTSEIKSWTRTPYRWVRMQSPVDTRLWAKVARGA